MRGSLRSWRGVVPSIVLSCVPATLSQVTWGPGPLRLSDTDDVANQQRLHEVFRSAYLTDYTETHPEHSLMSSISSELSSFSRQLEQRPSLALGVASAKYNFAWFRDGTAEMDVDSVQDAATLFEASIVFSGCAHAELPLEMFVQLSCTARWQLTVMLWSELGREYASRYLTDSAAATLEHAVVIFDEMMRLPYYKIYMRWQHPYDMNFNHEWFHQTVPSDPIWEKSSVPLASFLEANHLAITSELLALDEDGQLERLHFRSIRAEGQDWAPESGYRVVELMTADVELPRWSTEACIEAPLTCSLLAERPELQCAQASASLVRLQAGGRYKPHFGAAPAMEAHLVLRADIGAGMSVGNRTVEWKTGEAVVLDGTHIQQQWHNGVRGNHYRLQVTFCHPCLEAQRDTYPNVTCPPREDALDVDVPFAAAALWAAGNEELAKCNAGVGKDCPPDTQHGGINPLSALNTWNYALNNVKVALQYAGVQVHPSVITAIAEVQAATQLFLQQPALELFAPIVTSAAQIFEELTPWLAQQPPFRIRLRLPPWASSVVDVPSDGTVSVGRASFTLSNGVSMPMVGFGTWKLEGEACYKQVRAALDLGVRHIDTAEAYGNEAEIGRALRDSGVPRSDIFLVTKATRVAMGAADPDHLEAIFAEQLQALETEYVDVYMLHMAGIHGSALHTVWANMESLLERGRIRCLGVSNFGTEELEELWSWARVKPVYVQNIFKVYKPGAQILGDGVSLLDWAKSHGVAVVGYSIINSWPHVLNPLEDPHVVSVARASGRTPSQVLHRWALQRGVAVIPKASSFDRIKENIRLFDFHLGPSEMAALDGLATLAESTHSEVLPSWSADIYGLQR